MQKPINLTMEEAKQDFVNAINEIKDKYNLPMYLTEIILRDIYNEVVHLKQKELELSRQEYEKSKEKKEGTKK